MTATTDGATESVWAMAGSAGETNQLSAAETSPQKPSVKTTRRCSEVMLAPPRLSGGQNPELHGTFFQIANVGQYPAFAAYHRPQLKSSQQGATMSDADRKSGEKGAASGIRHQPSNEKDAHDRIQALGSGHGRNAA